PSRVCQNRGVLYLIDRLVLSGSGTGRDCSPAPASQQQHSSKASTRCLVVSARPCQAFNNGTGSGGGSGAAAAAAVFSNPWPGLFSGGRSFLLDGAFCFCAGEARAAFGRHLAPCWPLACEQFFLRYFARRAHQHAGGSQGERLFRSRQPHQPDQVHPRPAQRHRQAAGLPPPSPCGLTSRDCHSESLNPCRFAAAVPVSAAVHLVLGQAEPWLELLPIDELRTQLESLAQLLASVGPMSAMPECAVCSDRAAAAEQRRAADRIAAARLDELANRFKPVAPPASGSAMFLPLTKEAAPQPCLSQLLATEERTQAAQLCIEALLRRRRRTLGSGLLTGLIECLGPEVHPTMAGQAQPLLKAVLQTPSLGALSMSIDQIADVASMAGRLCCKRERTARLELYSQWNVYLEQTWMSLVASLSQVPRRTKCAPQSPGAISTRPAGADTLWEAVRPVFAPFLEPLESTQFPIPIRWRPVQRPATVKMAGRVLDCLVEIVCQPRPRVPAHFGIEIASNSLAEPAPLERRPIHEQLLLYYCQRLAAPLNSDACPTCWLLCHSSLAKADWRQLIATDFYSPPLCPRLSSFWQALSARLIASSEALTDIGRCYSTWWLLCNDHFAGDNIGMARVRPRPLGNQRSPKFGTVFDRHLTEVSHDNRLAIQMGSDRACKERTSGDGTYFSWPFLARTLGRAVFAPLQQGRFVAD
uniref:FATC domain-containing protein n=1 Tax=Macrostomum lignano TaxID=282301 RepID=A0A1I8FRZ0_9PLAT